MRERGREGFHYFSRPPVNFWMKGILEEGETVVNGGTRVSITTY